jgi:very-short-patch-repair endonuclease
MNQEKLNYFIEKANEIHKNIYDYSLVEFNDVKSKFNVICNIHGNYLTNYNSHIYKKRGCSKCSIIKRSESKKKTIKQFIEEAMNIHGTLYDYSKSVYINYNTNLIIICKIHGDFLQTPNSHIGLKCGCFKCSPSYKISNDEFIKKAMNKFGDRYDYSNTKYINSVTKVEIKCMKHNNIFYQPPKYHISERQGCNFCLSEHFTKIQTKPLEKFIDDANIVHNNKYDYSLVEYKNSDTKMCIKCIKHDTIFYQTGCHHLSGKSGCKLCFSEKIHEKNTKTTEEFVNECIEIYGDKYDYSLTEYKGSDKKINIICKLHNNKFFQVASIHINYPDRLGCKKCIGNSVSERNLLTTEEFILNAIKIHNDDYNYEKVNYKGAHDKIIIICKKNNHEFLQSPSTHLSGSGCPKCMYKTQSILFNELVVFYPNLKEQYKVDWCKRKNFLPFDFVLENEKIIIESDGDQHFKQVSNWSTPEKQLENDIYKMKCANENNFSIIRILQMDIYKNKYDWLNELKINIEKIINDNIIQNIYMCKNNEYKKYIL